MALCVRSAANSASCAAAIAPPRWPKSSRTYERFSEVVKAERVAGRTELLNEMAFEGPPDPSSSSEGRKCPRADPYTEAAARAWAQVVRVCGLLPSARSTTSARVSRSMRVARSAGTDAPRVARCISSELNVAPAPVAFWAGHSTEGEGAVEGAPPMCAGGAQAAEMRVARAKKGEEGRTIIPLKQLEGHWWRQCLTAGARGESRGEGRGARPVGSGETRWEWRG